MSLLKRVSTYTRLIIPSTDYDSAMGRIIAVNLAHWRKRQQKRTQQRASNDSLEYPGNVEENIETANEGYTS